MTRLLLILLLCASVPPPILAQQMAIPNRPELSVSLEPRRVKTEGAYVQAQIRLRIQLVSPHPFEALTLDLPPIAAARTLTLSPPHTRKINNYSREGYVYETRLALFPEHSGVLTIPPVSVVGVVATGSNQQEAFAEVSPAMSVLVKPITPDYDSEWWLVADAVTMTEVWSPPPEQIRVGDIVRRDVTVTVHGVTAAYLPTIEQPDNRGYSVVGSATTTKNDFTPDGVTAIVRQFWDLRIESAEVIAIGPIRLTFWDPVAGAMTTASLPAKRIEPLPRDVAVLQAQLMHEAMTRHRNRRLLLCIVLSVPGLVLLALTIATLCTLLPTGADCRLLRTCTVNSTSVVCLRAVTRWSRDSFGADGYNAIGPLQQQFSGEVTDRLDALQRRLFSAADVSTDPERLARSLIKAARRYRLHAFWQWIIRGLHRLIDTRGHPRCGI